MLTAHAQSRPVIVTGADQSHARTLWQFLRSAERRGLQSTYRWLVYDLGLGLAARDRLTRAFPWISMRSFEFAAYPAHVALYAGGDGWRPIIITEVLDEFHAPVLWLDSATIVTSDLREPFRIMAKHGVVSLRQQAPLGELCSAQMMKRLDFPPELLHKPKRTADVIGFDPSHKVARDLANSWARLALLEGCEASRNSAIGGISSEVLLSALLYKSEAQGLLTLNQDEADIDTGHPMRWLTTRNTVKPWLPRLADPGSRLYHWLSKSSDQFKHRYRDWEKRNIGGKRRRYREHFEVSVQRGGGAPVIMTSPSDGYYTDPFPLQANGAQYLLAAEYNYAKARSRLVCLTLDEALRPVAAEPILDEESHCSFPFAFKFGGVSYLVPARPDTRSIDLFVMGGKPAEWSLGRVLLYGIDAVNTVLIRHLGLWWLITSVKQAGAQNRHLEIYYAQDLLQDEFKPHPVNGERRYHDKQHGTGRNAGSFIRTPAGWIRPMQESSNHYGEGTQLMLIKRLDAENFEEVPATQVNGYTDAVEALSPHHIALGDDVLCWDVRDRAR